MTEYTVVPIPYPPSEAHITCYTTIRLQGLQTDPHAFGSTYERESNFTRDQWKARLDSQDKITFVARTEKRFDRPKEVSGDGWVGTATVLNPDMIQALGYEHLAKQNEAIYILVGMWVHPDHRRQGLGRLLVAAAKQFVYINRDAARTNVLMLELHKNKTPAKRLYESMGFTDAGPAGDSGEIWMLLLNDNEAQISSPNKQSFGKSIHTQEYQ